MADMCGRDSEKTDGENYRQKKRNQKKKNNKGV